MPKTFKNIVKSTKPTKSVSVSNKHSNKKDKEIEKYNKMSDIEKLNYDLDQDKKREKRLRHAMRNKGYKSTKLNDYINSVVGNYDPKVVHLKNLVSSGKDLISIKIHENKFKNQEFTIDKIKKISNKLSNLLKQNNVNGKLMTALYFDDLAWKSGYLRNFGEQVKLYDPNDLYNLEVPFEMPTHIRKFNIYIALGNRDAGGSDNKFNDCLYNCLKYFVFNIEEYFGSACNFKTNILKLGRNDKVPLSYIDIIEKKLKTFKINVRGDYIRTSTISSNLVINLNLLNEHYLVDINEIKLLQVYRYEEKKPIMWDKKTFEAYDGITKWNMTKNERNQIIYNFNNPNIIIHRKDQGRNENGERIKISIEEEFNIWIQCADELKEESKGLINLYKTGSDHDTALSLFERLNKAITPEPILQDEAEWIKLSSFSALIWAEVGYKGPLYKHDVKSEYPYLMSLNTLKFPIRRGEFQQIEHFKEFIEFGIYRCVIMKSGDENIDKLFKFNFHNYYTSVDISHATKLGLQIQLIQDSKPNFLYYSGDKTIKFSQAFKNYIDIMFPLKEKKVRTAKDILTIIWGALSEVDKRKQFVTDSFKIDEDEEICEIYPCSTDEDGIIIKTTKMNKYYKSNYARLCPFIIANGRKYISDIMFEHRNNIKRISTDGFLITTPIHYKTEAKLGELKYEGYNEEAEIKNKINYINFRIN
jgi:hypothetical protein